MQMIRKNLRDVIDGASNLHFNEKIKELQKSGEKIHHLGFGQSPFPVPEIAQAELKKFAHVAEYLPVTGLPELRKVICNLHHRLDQLFHFDADDVIVGPGSKELIFQMMNLISGDVVLLSPTWTTYAPQAHLAAKRTIVVRTTFEDGWKLTPSALEKNFKDKKLKDWSLLILCNPDNPTGAVYTEKELKNLSEMMKKFKLLVLSDEIYSRLSFAGNHTSLAKFYPEGTILSSGISKWASCGGWRLGYLIFPTQLSRLRHLMTSAASQTYTSVSAPIQLASIKLLSFGDECVSYVKHCSRILQEVAKFCCNKLQDVGVKVHMSGSGYYIFPDFEVIRNELENRGVKTGDEMCKLILKEAKVALMAGGPHYLHPPEALTVRLCYVNFDGKFALKASKEIGLNADLSHQFLQLYCYPTVHAINSIASWVSGFKKSK